MAKIDVSALLSKAKKSVLFIAVLLIAAVSAVSVVQLPPPIVDKMLERDMMDQAVVWRTRIVSQIEGGADAFAEGDLSSSDIAFLSEITHASDVYLVKLFNRHEQVIWSSRMNEIGTTSSIVEKLGAPNGAQPLYLHETKQASQIDDFELHARADSTSLIRHVAEIHMPVMSGGSVTGAVEFFTDITDLRATFITRVRTVLGVVAGVGVLLLMAMLMIVTRANARQVGLIEARSENERKSMEEQMRLAREVRLLGELNEWLQSSRSLNELFTMVARFLTHILPDSEGSVYVYSNSRDVLDGAASWNGGEHKDHMHPDGCWGLRRGRTYTFGDSEVDFVCEHAEPHDGRPYFCFPILAHGETVGLMHLRARTEASVESFRANQRLAQMCAEQISMAIANVQMRDQLHDRSVRDALTGLFNRRHLTDSLRRMIARAQKDKAPLCLVSVDVDHFKKFNDNHGHDAGDMVLRAVGAALEQACDGDELACRMGGEEFMLLYPEVTPIQARERAEKLREAVEQITVRYGERALPRVTISVGVAHFPEHGMMPQDLMRVADDALYDAKAKGRNQVVMAGLKDAASPHPAKTEPRPPNDQKKSAKVIEVAPSKATLTAQNPMSSELADHVVGSQEMTPRQKRRAGKMAERNGKSA